MIQKKRVVCRNITFSKKVSLFVLALAIAAVLSLTALSQLNPITNTATVKNQITPTISIDEDEICTTSFFNNIQDVYSNCVYYANYTSCLNTSGPNTACSFNQSQWDFKCKTGETSIISNKTECRPSNKFTVSIKHGAFIESKELDFSSWGVCIAENENSCAAVICGSQHGGSAVNGAFNGCDGGKSCQKFLFCKDGIKALYKASRSDFAEQDPTFHLSKLELKKVGK